MRNWKHITIFIIALLILIVVLQNTAVVETHLLFFTISMPRALLLFLTFLIGFLLGVFLTISRERRS